jgi:zinc transport system substrate-binding protein
MRTWVIIVVAVCAAVLVAKVPASGVEVPSSAQAPSVQILVSIAPLRQIVSEIVPDGFQVKPFLPAGAQPESYEPSPRQMAEVSQAQWFVSAGVPFEEALLPRLQKNAPQLRVLRPFGAASKHAHQDEDHHDHPHRWLSPPGLDLIAQTVADALIESFGPSDARSQEVRTRLEVARRRNAELDQSVRAKIGGHRGLAFFVYHPAWDSFAEHFALKQEALEHMGHAPTARRMVAFVQMLKASRTKVIFSQPQINPAPVAAAAEGAGVGVVLVDPLAPDVRKEILGLATLLAEDFKKRGVQP